MEWASMLQTNVDKGLRTRLKDVLSTAVAFDALWVCVSATGTMPEYLELDSYISYGHMRRNKFGGGVGIMMRASMVRDVIRQKTLSG